MAIELAVFRRPVVWVCGGAESLSLLVEFRDNQENGLVSFRVGGPECCGGGEATAFIDSTGLFDGDSPDGDQGIGGRAFVMLLNDKVLLARSFSGGLGGAEIV